MSWHPEVLTRLQQRVLAQVGPFLRPHGFFPAGGTAVALHLGHRRAVDLDWFTDERKPQPLQLAQEIRETGAGFVTKSVAPGTLHGSVAGVRLSLLEYLYPLLVALRRCLRDMM